MNKYIKILFIFICLSVFVNVFSFDFKAYRYYNSKIGYIGNNYIEKNINYNYKIGYIGNINSQKDYINIAKVGYIGNNYIEKNINYNYKIGYIGNINSQKDYINIAKVGYIGNKYIEKNINYDYKIGYIGNINFQKGIVYDYPIGLIGLKKEKSYLTLAKTIYKNINNEVSYLNSIKEKYVSKAIETYNDMGDPVNLNNGEFTYSNNILAIKGGLNYNLELYYSNQVDYNGPLGNNFDFSYNKFLTLDNSGNIIYYNGKLGNIKFEKDIDGTFKFNKSLKAYIETYESGSYKITFNNKTFEYFDENLRLSEIKDLFNNYLTFEYDDYSRLSKTKTKEGKEVIYEYLIDNKLYKITGPNNYIVNFEYYSDNDLNGSKGDIKNILINNNSKFRNSSFTYTKSNVQKLAHNMVRLIDSNGKVYVENIYSNDRVLRQRYGNGTIYYNYTLGSNNNVIKNQVVNKNNIKTNYYYNNLGLSTKKEIITNSGSIIYNYEYDEAGNILKEIYPKGNGYKYIYDESGNLVEKRFKQSVVGEDSLSDLVYKYTYDEYFNVINGIINPNGKGVFYNYDDYGNLAGKAFYDVEDYNKEKYDIIEGYEYDENGNVSKYTNPNGNITYFEYKDNNLIKTISGTGQNQIIYSFNYDKFGNIIEKIDPEGNKTFLTYNDFNLLTSIKSQEGIITNYNYDNLNNKTKEEIILEDNSKFEKNYKYDILDNITYKNIKQTQYKSKVEIISYDGNNNIVQTKDENNATSYFEYNYDNKIIKKKVFDKNNVLLQTISYNYDENGNLINEINSKNQQKTYVYDLYDRLIKEININKSYLNYTYDNVGNIIEIYYYSPSGNLKNKKSFIYDDLGNRIISKEHIIKNGNEVGIKETKTKYNKLLKVIENILPDNKRELFSYDEFERLVYIKDKNDKEVFYTYNKLNKIINEKQKIGKSILEYKYYYDLDSRLVKVENPNGSSISYKYTNLNYIKEKTDENGVKTSFEYDYFGNITKETVYIGNEIFTSYFFYNTKNNLTKLVDKNGNILNYVYDEFGRIIQEQKNGIFSKSYVYDGYDKLISKTNSSNEVKYIYDELDNLVGKEIRNLNSSIIQKEIFEYDEHNRLVKAQNENSIVFYTYNENDKVIKETQGDQEINYVYDELNGNLLSKKYPNGKILTYIYDEKDNVVDIKLDGQTIVKYEYDDFLKTKEIYKENIYKTYAYDELNRVKSLNLVANENVKSYNYTYNNLDFIIDDNYEKYTYDGLGNLTQVNYKNSSKESFIYDKAGNRKQRVSENILQDNKKTVENYTTNSLNQYTNLSKTSSGEILEQSFVYDKEGNIKEDYAYIYEYDYENRLIKLSSKLDNKIITYKYDVFGRRIEKIIGNDVIKYTYSGDQAIIEKSLDYEKVYYSGKDKIDDIIGFDYILGSESKRYFLLKDLKNNTQILANEEGIVKEKYLYDAFGKVYIKTFSEIKSIENTGSIIQTNSGETLQNTGSITQTSSGKLLQNTGSTTETNSGEILQNTGSTTETNSGEILQNTGSITETSSGETLQNTGSTTETSSGETLQNTGSITQTSSGELLQNTGSITETNSGETLQNTGSITETSSLELLQNTGSITQTNSGETLQNTGSITQTNSGETLQNTGSITQTNSGETLQNTGSITETSSLENIQVKENVPILSTIDINEANTLELILSGSESGIYYDGEYYKLYSESQSINNILFAGRELEKESELYYYRARYYNYELGRFISEDPIGIKDNINKYVYVGNNPIMFVDPSGLAARQARYSVDEETRIRIDGAGKVVIGGLESLGGATSIVGGVGLCTAGIAGTAGLGGVPACAGGGVAVVYGSNYLVSGATEMGGGIHQMISGKRNNAYFNAGHKVIDATISDKETAENVKLSLDVADLGVGVSKGIYSGGKILLSKVGKSKKVEEKVLNNLDDISYLVNNKDSLALEELMSKATKGDINEFYQKASQFQKGVDEKYPYSKGTTNFLGFGGVKNLDELFKAWLNRGEKNVSVYIGYKDGKAVYVGITNDVTVRQAQHYAEGGKGIKIDKIVTGLTKNQARTIEQNLIEANEFQFDYNLINSIGEKNKMYYMAVDWGKNFMEKNNIDFTGY